MRVLLVAAITALPISVAHADVSEGVLEGASPARLAIGIGIAVALIAGGVWFAWWKRRK